ncbi:MAG: ABC transporter permease [Lentisphaerae bacterium]|nr:ABC transporter permease [Lentisphaerota bacterium]
MNAFTGNMFEIFKREFRAYFASPVAYVFLVFYLMLIGFLTFFVSRFYEANQADLKYFFFWFPWVNLLLVPAATMRLWTEERRTGTLELLMTLPVTLPQALVGKFLAAWLFMMIGVLLTLPVVFTTIYLGSPDAGAVIGGYAGAILLSGAYVAVGTLTSAMTRNQVISFVIAFVICLFLALAGWPPVMEIVNKWAPGWLVNGIASLSVMPHFESLQRGVIDVRDVIYYVSVMALALFGAHLVLENRKSS